MPTFEFLSVRDAHLELTLRGSRGEILREYMGYIEQLDPGHAGRLTAAQLLGKRLEVTRDGRVVYFWEGREDLPRRRGRPPRSERSG